MTKKLKNPSDATSADRPGIDRVCNYLFFRIRTFDLDRKNTVSTYFILLILLYLGEFSTFLQYFTLYSGTDKHVPR